MTADEAPILEADEEHDQAEKLSSDRYLRVGLVVVVVAAVGVVMCHVGAQMQTRGAPRDVEGLFLLESKTSKHGKEHGKSEEKSCSTIKGVQLMEPKHTRAIWPKCAAKWSEDCSKSGCCLDGNMRCYRKNSKWAACLEKCQRVDEQNKTWACEEVWPATPHTSDACVAECRGEKTCKQVMYDSDAGGSCKLANERQTKIAWAGDNVNSSFCGVAGEQPQIKELIDTVSKQLPFRVEWPLVNCSWGGDDCSKTRCCNDFSCDADFKECWGFSCYKKDKYFAGCTNKPLKGWDGKWLGGPREHRIIPQAGSTAAVQGTSLYCFTVVTWDAPRPKPFWNSEAELAENWRSQGLHILQCDGHDILDGVITAVAEWGSFSNIDMFMQIWQKVKGIGAWRNYDWTVKVDSDAVFLPLRLKQHLDQLRTPLGARVYLENINYKFKFMGAIEIMTREALALFLEQGHTCIRGKHEGGEDSFLKTCLDGLGIDHMSDWQILRDKYAGLNPPCNDGWAVAYHYLKKTHDWSTCYNEVVCGVGEPKKGVCDGAILVPHEPGFIVKNPEKPVV